MLFITTISGVDIKNQVYITIATAIFQPISRNLPTQNHCKHQEGHQETNIRRRKIPKIRPFDLAFLPRDEFIGDQACHGRDQRSQPTQVDANDQRGQVLRKPRQQQRSRNITDHLAGGNAGQDFVPGDELL